MSLPLLRTTIRKNWLLLFIFVCVLTMYTSVMVTMYSPDDVSSIEAMFELLPASMMQALGFSQVFTNLTGYLASWLYGMLMIAFPMVYSIILGNRLVAKTVDSGSMVCLLSTPNSRTKIIATKGIYAYTSMAVLQMALFGIATAVSQIMFPGELNIGAFFQLNLTVMLVNMAILGVTFFFSCLFNDTKYSLGLGSGIPIAFLLMNMMGNTAKELEVLKKISPYGWYDPLAIANGESALTLNLIYGGIALGLLLLSIWIFKKKRLPI